MILNRESTFYQNLDVPFKKSATTIALDSTGSFAALGGKKGLYISDLEEPWDVPKLLHHGTKSAQWEISVLQWNPNAQFTNQIASAANKELVLWNVEDKRSAYQFTHTPHSRPVADLAWSVTDGNVLATCSADTYVHLWDLRQPKAPLKLKSFCAWTIGASMVRWNRKNPRILASAHEGEILIWDFRKESAPIVKITAHKQISSFDWAYHSESQIVTSSLDRTVKFWDTQQPTVCQGTLQTSQSVSKVKYTPFGRAIITISQRSDFAIRMWTLSDLEQPVHQFLGHKEVISAIDWRIRDDDNDYEYQLASWSKDQCLRLWAIDPNLLNAMQTKEIYGNRSSLPSASTSLTNPVLGSFGVYQSLGTSVTGSLLPENATPLASPRRSNMSPSTPNTPAPNQALQSITILNLDQEFAMLQRRPIPGIVIEEMSISQRTFQVRLGRLPYLLRIKITFPSMYPNVAAPSFDILPLAESEVKALSGILTSNSPSNPSILNTPAKLSDQEKLDVKVRAKNLLTKVAYGFVSINLVCVDPCLNFLLALLESFHANPSLTSQLDDPDMELPVKPEEYYKGFTLSSGSVPVTPSRTDSNANSTSETPLSSSYGSNNALRGTRLTFSETGSTALPFSPPRKIGLDHRMAESKLPKTQSDVNLSKFVDSDYLHHAYNSSHSARLPVSQSSSSLSTLSAKSIITSDSNSIEDSRATVDTLKRDGPPSTNGSDAASLEAPKPTIPHPEHGSPRHLDSYLFGGRFTQHPTYGEYSAHPEHPGSPLLAAGRGNNQVISTSSPSSMKCSIDITQNIIPCPRRFGASFFGTGKLLVFGQKAPTFQRQHSHTLNYPLNDIRTYDQMMDVLANSKSTITTVASSSNLQYDGFILEGEEAMDMEEGRLRAHMNRTSSLNDLQGILLDSSMDDLSDASHRGHHHYAYGFHETVHSHVAPATSIRYSWNDSISVFEISFAIPISQQLAKLYTLVGNNTPEICAINTYAAKLIKRRDLVKAWSLLEAQTNLGIYPAIPGDEHFRTFSHPWALHPMGRSLLQSLFRHYERIKDVQTLAMLSMAVAGPMSLHGPVRHFPVQIDKPSSSSLQKFAPHHQRAASESKAYTTHTESQNAPAATRHSTILPRFTPTGPAPKPPVASGNATSQPLSRITTHLSPQRIPTDIPNYSLIDPKSLKQCNAYRRQYAEILYMWGEYVERARVLKYVADPWEGNDGVEFDVVCGRCGKPSKTPYCQSCKIYAFNCDLCHTRVKGLSTFCLKCGHGGHSDHVKDWFVSEVICPAGCGCACLEIDM